MRLTRRTLPLLLASLTLHLMITVVLSAKRRPSAQTNIPGRSTASGPGNNQFQSSPQFQANHYQPAPFQPPSAPYQMFQPPQYQPQYPPTAQYFVPQFQHQPAKRNKQQPLIFPQQQQSPYGMQTPFYPPVAPMYPSVANAQLHTVQKGKGKSRSAKRRARRRARKQAARRVGPTLKQVLKNKTNQTQPQSTAALSGEKLIADLRGRVVEAQKKLEEAYQLLNGLTQQMRLLTETTPQISSASSAVIKNNDMVNGTDLKSTVSSSSNSTVNQPRFIVPGNEEDDEAEDDLNDAESKLEQTEEQESVENDDFDSEEKGESDDAKEEEDTIADSTSPGFNSTADDHKNSEIDSDNLPNIMKSVNVAESQLEPPPVPIRATQSGQENQDEQRKETGKNQAEGTSSKVVEEAQKKLESAGKENDEANAKASPKPSPNTAQHEATGEVKPPVGASTGGSSSSAKEPTGEQPLQVKSAVKSDQSVAAVAGAAATTKSTPVAQQGGSSGGTMINNGANATTGSAAAARPPVFTFSATSSTSGDAMNRQSSLRRGVRRTWNRARLLAQKNSLLNGALLKGVHHASPYLQSAGKQVRETADMVSRGMSSSSSSSSSSSGINQQPQMSNFNFNSPIPPLPPIPPIPSIPPMPYIAPLPPVAPPMARGEFNPDKRRRLSDDLGGSHFEQTSSVSDSGPVISVGPNGTTVQQHQQASVSEQQTSSNQSGASLKRSNSSVFSSMSQSSSSSSNVHSQAPAAA